MAIKFRCPGCGTEDIAAEAMAGQKVACAGCGRSIRLPRPTPPAAPGDPIRFRCDGCGKSLSAPAHLAGKKITCKSCGRTGLKIPGGSASTAPASTPAPAPVKPRPVAGLEPFAADPSAIDLYGLEEAPSPPMPRPGGGGDELFADSGATPAVAKSKSASGEALPPRAGAFEAMTAEKKKKINKRADKITKAGPSFAGAGLSASFGTIIAITLFGWRLYRIGHKVTRGLDDPPIAAAPFEAGVPLDPKAAAAEGDRDVARMLKEPGAAEAREWLDPARHPDHGVFEMGNERARAMVAGFYERGARRVSVVDASPLGNTIMTAMIAVELPDEPDKRAQCLAWETQYLEGEEATKDLGQKYLLITTD